MQELKPKWRTGVGMALILLIILTWSIAVVALSPFVSSWWWPVQIAFYLVAGVAWVLPLRPLLYWMETGSRRRPVKR